MQREGLAANIGRIEAIEDLKDGRIPEKPDDLYDLAMIATDDEDQAELIVRKRMLAKHELLIAQSIGETSG